MTLEKTKEVFSDLPKEKGFHHHLGNFSIEEDYTENEVFKSVKWLQKELGLKLRKMTWGDASKLIKDGKFWGWHGLKSQSFNYHYFLPHGYTEVPEVPVPGHAGMDFKNVNDEYEKIGNFCDFSDVDYDYDTQRDVSLNSSYYHSAKAHWLVDNIRKEGLWHPIQGKVEKQSGKFRFAIHPGSVRSAVFEILDDPTLEMMIWDGHDAIDLPEITLEEYIEDLKNNDKASKPRNISFNYANGYFEVSLSGVGMDFRKTVYRFNERVSKEMKGKHINFYIGYDSTHTDIAELSKKCLEHAIKFDFGGGDINGCMTKWKPEIKFLDISKIPEYTRDYAQQSTEFTYSRFLVPYLENYEGFSIFFDDDILFQHTPLPMFYFLDLDNAVACLQYDFEHHDETKMNNQKNVSYPKKLWSSFMIFNNAHEDCKKLTPEVINTASGKYLHQFEWTDKISEIPEHFIATEGFDNTDTKWRPSGIHYTRGGPWIKDMDTSEITYLNIYEKLLAKHKN